MLIRVGCGGVDLTFLHHSMLKVLMAVSNVWGKEEPIITSTAEGTHLPWSYHYIGRALDFRFPLRKEVETCIKELKEKLGEDYDVVEEEDHIHIEYDPKG